MKIELKLTPDHIAYLDKQFSSTVAINLAEFKALEKDRRVMVSILIDVADKIAAKSVKLQRSHNLFEARKKHKVTIKYYEAWAVHLFLTGAINLETDPYRKSLALTIHGQIDPKLL